MCGIAGIFSPTQRSKPYFSEILTGMNRRLHHRGPDDEGFWIDESKGIGLAHRRLSVIDLESSGHQPMASPSGRYTLVYNGEIYNYKQLKRALDQAAACTWRGQSDTEVVLRAIEVWGLEHALKSFAGMFAFALWDKQEQKLILARDRMGEKPLYYGFLGDCFMFGSELKAILAMPDAKPTIDKDALALFFKYGYVPTPYSIYKNIFKLTPGSYLEIDQSMLQQTTRVVPKPYWQARDYWQNDSQIQPTTLKGATDSFESIMETVIQEQLISDVPIGAFLSGGIDSSLVVALMQKHSTTAVKTFSIGFESEAFNEAVFAKNVANHLKTDHTELYVSNEDMLDVVPKLPEIYDEPFADSSQIPTYLVSGLAKSKVTVALSGDGADELFGGYNRYFMSNSLLKYRSMLPAPISNALGNILCSLPAPLMNQVCRSIPWVKNLARNDFGYKLHKLGRALKVTPEEIYETLITNWTNDQVPELVDLPSMMQRHSLETPHLTSRMMFADMLSYLPDDILVKVDRASMAHSLETRAPFLDRRVVEWAGQLPLQYKIQGNKGKLVLREALGRYVPTSLTDRPKQGFGVPLASWLRGPLRAWGEDLLSPQSMDHPYNIAPIEMVQQKWKAHQSKQGEHQFDLWPSLMFQAWYKKHKVNLG